MQFQLDRTQWLTAEQIVERQKPQLGRLLAHAYDTVPYYRQRLDEVGLPPAAIQGPDEWRRIPVLSRAEVQAAGERLFSASVPAEHGPVSKLFTSGSTGRPLLALGTGVTQVPGFRATVDDPSAAPGRRTFVPCRYQRTEGDAAIVLCA